MYELNGKAFVDEDDQCNKCRHYANMLQCPLILALGHGLVVINENDFTVKNCKLFVQHLEIVK